MLLKGRKWLDLLIITLVTGGFSYQISLLCDEYFKYVTTTTVAVMNALDVTNIPQVSLCTEQSGSPLTPVKLFREQLMDRLSDGSYPGGDPKMIYFNLNRFKGKQITQANRVLKENHGYFKRFLKYNNNCFSLKTQDPVNLTLREVLIYPSEEMVRYSVQVKTPFTGNGRAMEAFYFVTMTSYYSDFDSNQGAPLIGVASMNRSVFLAFLSFSQKVTKLLPPPFDTDCRDYRRKGLVSRENCEKTCLNDYTVSKYNGIFEDHVVEHKRFMIRTNFTNETAIRPVWYLLKDEALSVDVLLRYAENCYNLSRTYRKDPVLAQQFQDYADYVTSQASILPDIRKRLALCKEECNRPDCETEHIVPFPLRLDSHGPMVGNLSYIRVHIYAPREPVIIVASKQKIKILDLVVYVLSCVSFWYGFCPLKFSKTWRTVTIDSMYSKVKQAHARVNKKVKLDKSRRTQMTNLAKLRNRLKNRRTTRVHTISQPEQQVVLPN